MTPGGFTTRTSASVEAFARWRDRALSKPYPVGGLGLKMTWKSHSSQYCAAIRIPLGFRVICPGMPRFSILDRAAFGALATPVAPAGGVAEVPEFAVDVSAPFAGA